MQPVFPYRAQGYPPRGNRWPQFGDNVLEETLSLSEGARQSLNKKREAMSDFHKEIMERHRLAPKVDPQPRQPDEIPVPDEDDWYGGSGGAYTPGPGDPPPQPMETTDSSNPPQGPPPDYPSRRPFVAQAGAVARYDPPPKPLAAQTVTGGGYDPPAPPGAGAIAVQTDRPRRPLVAQSGSVTRYDPPDNPGASAQTDAPRKRLVTQVGKVTSYDPSNDVEVLGGGGGPPPPPGAGGVLVPTYAAGPDPAEEHAYSYPPGEMPGPAFLEPRVRPTPYGQPRTKINGKQPPSLKDEFFETPAESMDTAASAPAAIVPMEEQNSGVKRAKEEAAPKAKAKSKAKKKKDEIVATQSPPSLPPPPPGGAAALKVVAEPDMEPASASSANAPTSVPHYRQKEGSTSSSSRKKPPPDAAMVEPAAPVKRKTDKPLDDDTPAALRPERQRPRAPQAEPDAEPTPLRPSSSSSSKGPSVASQGRLL